MTFQLGHVPAPCGSNTSTSLYFRHDEKIFLSSLIVPTLNQLNYSEKCLCCNSPYPLLVPQVFFTRNGKLMGRREMAVPPGGLYPTVGMLSSGEKVKVDLHPLSG